VYLKGAKGETLLFTGYGVDNLVYGKRSRLVLVGAIAGTLIIYLPLIFFIFQSLYFLVVQLLSGERLLSSTGGFLNNLRAIVSYVKSVWLFSALSGVIFGIQTLWSRFSAKRRKLFEFDTGGRFNISEFFLPWDAVAFSLLFPLILPSFFAEVAGLMVRAPIFYFLSGFILYLVWSLVFELLMSRLKVITTQKLLEFSLAEVLDFYEWHGKCLVDVNLDDSKKIAIVKGQVERKEQISHVVSSLKQVRGIVDVDTTELKIVRPKLPV
jgi:hypothetical protein